MASYDDYLQCLKVVDDRTLEELHQKENELVAKIATLKKSHQDEIMQMESTFKAKTAELKSQYTKLVEDNNSKCKDKIESNKKQAEALVRSVKNEMDKKVDEDKNIISELKAKHQSASREVKALKTQNAQLIQEKTELEEELIDTKDGKHRYKKALRWVSSSLAAIVLIFLMWLSEYIT